MLFHEGLRRQTCARESASARRVCTCALRADPAARSCVPTRVPRHLLRPPERGGCKAKARGLWRGKSPRRRFKLFRSAGDPASAALGCGFGRERPKPGLGSRVEPGLRCKRRWRRRVPEIHFQGRRSPRSCSRWKFPLLCWGRRGGEQAREPGSAEAGFETLSSPRPRRAGPGVVTRAPPRPFAKALRVLGGGGRVRDHQAPWKILEYILCVL